MIVIALLSYLLYNFAVTYYISYLFDCPKNRVRNYFLSVLFNSIMLLIPFYPTSLYLPIFIQFSILLSFILHFYFIYERNITKTLFTAYSFALNFLAIRFLIIGSSALYFNISIMAIKSNTQYQLYIGILSFLLPIPYILIAKKLSKREFLDLLYTSPKNIKFANKLLLLLYLNLIVCNVAILSFEEHSPSIRSFLIRVAIISIILYLLVMLCIYIYSNVRINALVYEKINERNYKEVLNPDEVSIRANIDIFTGFFLESVAKTAINTYISQGHDFYVARIDINNLSSVNKLYGHEEGDFYLRQIINEISFAFQGDTIARLSGSEFIVVGSLSNCNEIESIVLNKLILCSLRSKNIQKMYKKIYKTSISYGMVIYNEKNPLTCDELISITNNRIENFKISQNL